MSDPRTWTPAELASDAEKAKAIFRRRRLSEPRGPYSTFFKSFAPIVADMVDRLPSLTSDVEPDADTVADIIANDELRTAFRYLAAPPISEDDLKTLAETNLSIKALYQRRSDPSILLVPCRWRQRVRQPPVPRVPATEHQGDAGELDGAVLPRQPLGREVACQLFLAASRAAGVGFSHRRRALSNRPPRPSEPCVPAAQGKG